MSKELTSIAGNLFKIAAKAARDEEPFIEELARETHRLCEIIQRIEQETKADASSKGAANLGVR